VLIVRSAPAKSLRKIGFGGGKLTTSGRQNIIVDDGAHVCFVTYLVMVALRGCEFWASDRRLVNAGDACLPCAGRRSWGTRDREKILLEG
jgi:hypothetical protein